MKVLVFGQGKSGTTVIAKTIQHSLPGAAFLMEPKTADELVRRTPARHEVVKILDGQWKTNRAGLTTILRNEASVPFDRLFKIIRDPRDQAISSFLYNFYNMARSGRASAAQLQEMIALVRAKEKRPQEISFTSLCAEVNRIMHWRGYSSSWLLTESGLAANRSYWDYLCSLGEFGFLLRYESFMRGELDELESYLGFSLTREREVGEYARTKRSASWGNWREFFTPEDVELLRPLSGELLAEMGYGNWELRPAELLNPEHFSRYVERLIEEGRRSQDQ